MKKIIIVLIMVICLTLTSCRYTDEGNYDFIKKEDVESALTTYYAYVTLVNGEDSFETFTFVENENYFYYNYRQSFYLVDKASNDIYSINHSDKIKLLEQKTDFNYVENKKVLIDLLSEHIGVVNSDYQMSKNTTNLNGFDCYEYIKTTKVDDDNYIERKYFIDNVKGYCIKANTEICVGDNKSITSWYVNELNFESDYVNNYINDICSYESKVAEMEFDAWPDMGLGLLIPKCQSGKFMFAVDYGPNAIISIEEISLQEVISYTRSLVNYGYNAGKSTTNESEQYIYVTYNNDDILIKISYTPSFSRFTIRIIQSTKEEINKELGKL